MIEHIQVVPDKCRACRRCEVACIAAHHGMTFKEAMKHRDVLVSRVQVVKAEGFRTTVRCHQCDPAPCCHICPTGALQQEEDGRITMRVQLCIACKLCEAVCPAQAITIEAEPRAADAGGERVVPPEEPPEDLPGVLRGNAGAEVRDVDEGCAVRRADGQVDPLAVGRVLEGVVDEPREALRLVRDDREILLPLGLVHARRARHHLRVEPEVRERRAELVRDGGKQGQLLRGFTRAARRLAHEQGDERDAEDARKAKRAEQIGVGGRFAAWLRRRRSLEGLVPTRGRRTVTGEGERAEGRRTVVRRTRGERPVRRFGRAR